MSCCLVPEKDMQLFTLPLLGLTSTTVVRQQVFALPKMGFNATPLQLEASLSLFVQVSPLEVAEVKYHLHQDKGSNL